MAEPKKARRAEQHKKTGHYREVIGSCKKRSILERILNGDDCFSVKKLVSYANQMNGILNLYEKEKLSKEDGKYKFVKKAYEIIMVRLQAGGFDLDYRPKRKEEMYMSGKRYSVKL